MKPFLSIIIVSYNTKDLTLEAINSVYKVYSGNAFEIIVVDNASTDGSIEAIESVQRNKDNLKLIKNDNNLGFAVANNQGIEVSKKQHIFLLNSDTIVKKGALEKLMQFAQQNSDCGVVAPRLLNIDETIQASCFHLPTIKNAILEYWFGKQGYFQKYAPQTNLPTEVEAVVGAAFLITPVAFKKVGSLNPKYFFYFEDLDYCRSVRMAGLKIYYLPEAEIIHIHGASGKNIVGNENQWRRLIPSSKIYHGILYYYLLTAVIWLGQKWNKLLKGF